MYAAYEALSDRMKAYLDGLTAIHDGEDGLSRHLRQPRRRGQAGLPACRASGHPHPSDDRTARRSTLTAASTKRLAGVPRDESDGILRVPVRAHGKPALPVPLPVAREFDRLLGQSLRPASGDVGLLAAYAQREPGHGGRRQALLILPGRDTDGACS